MKRLIVPLALLAVASVLALAALTIPADTHQIPRDSGLAVGDPVRLRAISIGIPAGTPGVVISTAPDGTVRVRMDGFVLESSATSFVIDPSTGEE